MQTRIYAGSIACLTLGSDTKTIVEELKRTSVRLLLISDLQRIRKLKKSIKTTALADNQVSEMRRESGNEMKGIESLCKHLIKSEEG